MKSDILLGNDVVSKQEFTDFVKRVSPDFVPPLYERVNCSEWYDKIVNNGVFIIKIDKDSIVGTVVGYCNDKVFQKAYVTLVAVDKSYRRRGIAGTMLDVFCEYCKSHDMNLIGIHTNSETAHKLYLKKGFATISTEENEGFIRYYLEKQL